MSKAEPGPNGCLLWTASRDRDGYGKFQVPCPGQKPRQYHTRAHRFALAVKLGRWVEGCTLHSCDNPSCIAPEHLREGTQKENVRDMDARGRRGRGFKKPSASGERNPNAKLKDADLAPIRERRAAGERAVDLAVEYGVTPDTISAISTGRYARKTG